MKRKSLLILWAIFLGLAFSVQASAQSVQESFKKDFPHVKIDAINPTDIKGVYEIVAGSNIAYYASEPGYLIVGEIRDKNGVSVTQKRKSEIVAAKAKALPLDKAIKIGSGKGTIIEFTDPDCPYCRQASSFLSKKTDVTRYIFFLPLPMHQDAENKVRYVFCSSDRAKAYEEAMTGKLDDKKYVVCKTPEAEDLLKTHKEISARMGITGTPFFIVNDKAISGADTVQIDAALKPAGVKATPKAEPAPAKQK
jgi:thiol:disulfide interchange protein DsbC